MESHGDGGLATNYNYTEGGGVALSTSLNNNVDTSTSNNTNTTNFDQANQVRKFHLATLCKS